MVVVYEEESGFVCVMRASDSLLEEYSLHQIALKDVPEALPFWIVDESEIPTDRTFRDAWEISETMREPDGYGSPFNTFSEILENEIEDAEFEEVPDDNDQPE